MSRSEARVLALRPGAAPLARQLARAAGAAGPELLVPRVAEKLKTCLLDFLACAFEARPLPWSRQALSVIRPTQQGAGVIGVPGLTSPGDAAFANGTLGHGLVREDMHAASIGHHGVVVWPALLALAQCGAGAGRPVAGGDFLLAALVGYEAAARLGRALIDAELARLHRPTGLVSPLGAALGGGLLVGLGEDALTSALALAANCSAGLNAWPHWGGSDMYFHPGFAARSAVTCVELAAAGAYGSEGALDGEGGWFAAYRRGPAPTGIALFPDGEAEILAVYNKPVPACNFAQTASQAALHVAREVGGSRGPVRAVAIRVPAAAARYPGCDFTGPFERALQAKMSIQFCVAAALARGCVEEANYADLEDPEILRLVGLSRLIVDEALTARFPAEQGAEVEVTFAEGGPLTHRLDDVVPATPGEVRARFRAAATAAVGGRRAAELEALVDGLESTGDAGRLVALCLPPDAGAPGPSGARRQAR